MGQQWSPECSKLLENWAARSTQVYRAHYRSATSCRIYNYLLGVPLVILTTFIATEFFDYIRSAAQKDIPLSPNPSAPLELWSPVAIFFMTVVIVTPILAALQTFLRFPERAQAHKEAGTSFERLLLQIEGLLAWPPAGEEEQKQAVDQVRLAYEEFVARYPTAGSMSIASVRRQTDKANRASGPPLTRQRSSVAGGSTERRDPDGEG